MAEFINVHVSEDCEVMAGLTIRLASLKP